MKAFFLTSALLISAFSFSQLNITFPGGNQYVICSGQTLTVTPIVSGQVGVVAYEWSYSNTFSLIESNQSIFDFSGTNDQWIYLKVTDDVSTKIDSVEIVMGDVEISSIIPQAVTSCIATNDDGGLTINTNPSAGIGNYTFFITGGTQNISSSNSTGVFTGLYNGTYQISVTNNNTGCSLDTVAFISSTLGTPPSVTTFNMTPVTCSGDMNGTIELIGINGTAGNLPFDVVWTPIGGSPIDQNGVITTLPSNHTSPNIDGGLWSIDIIDGIGCATNLMLNLTEPDPLNLNPTTSEPLCFGQSNGSIYINATGGTSPLTFNIMDTDSVTLNQSNSNSAELLPSGWYYLELTDYNGCLENDSIFLDQPDSLYSNVQGSDPLCNGSSDGSAWLNQVYNAQGPVQIQWSPSNQMGMTATNLSSGSQNVIVVDSAGCVWQQTFNLVDPPALTIQTISSAPSLCRGNGIYQGTGTVSGTANGGTGTINYEWEDEQGWTASTNTWGNREPGWYYMSVSDQNGCTALDSIYVDSLNPEAVFTVDPLWGVNPLDVNIHDSSTNRVTNSWGFYSPSGSTFQNDIIGYDSLQPLFTKQLQGVGQHWICLVVANDFECYDTTCIDIQVGTAGVEDFENEAVIVYPNPTQGWATISIDPLLLKEVKVYDVSGRLIFIDNKQNIDLSNLSDGKYFLQVVTTKGTYDEIIIKE